MQLVSGIAGSLGSYSDPSIYIDQVLTINNRDPATIVNGIPPALAKTSTPSDEAALYESDPNYLHTRRLVEELDLPGYSPSAWQDFSTKENKLSERYRVAGDRLISETLLRIAVQNFAGKNQTFYLEAVLIGDFKELRQIVSVITSSGFYVPGIEMSWKGFCPDPHEIYNTNLKAALSFPDLKYPTGNIEGSETRITTAIPEYDNYLGKKWYCGSDGSGLLNDLNLLWLARNVNTKSLLVAGVLDRQYLDDSRPVIDIHYRLCLGVLACTLQGGVAILKIFLPSNRALLGIYSLFALFFARVRLVKFKQHPLDDNTVYLVGFECIGIPPNFFEMVLRSPSLANNLLFYLSQQTSQLHVDLNRILNFDLRNWLDRVRNIWSIRNL